MNLGRGGPPGAPGGQRQGTAPARAVGAASEHVGTALSQMVGERGDDYLSQAARGTAAGRGGSNAYPGRGQTRKVVPISLTNFMR